MRNNYDFIISHYTSPLAEEPPVQLTWKMAVAFPAIASVGLLVVFLFFDDIQVSALPLLMSVVLRLCSASYSVRIYTSEGHPHYPRNCTAMLIITAILISTSIDHPPHTHLVAPASATTPLPPPSNPTATATATVVHLHIVDDCSHRAVSGGHDATLDLPSVGARESVHVIVRTSRAKHRRAAT